MAADIRDNKLFQVLCTVARGWRPHVDPGCEEGAIYEAEEAKLIERDYDNPCGYMLTDLGRVTLAKMLLPDVGEPTLSVEDDFRVATWAGSGERGDTWKVEYGEDNMFENDQPSFASSMPAYAAALLGAYIQSKQWEGG